MYNLNVDLATSAANAANSLLVESASNTPRTPEILNSLIAMTNPLDNYSFEDTKKNFSGALPMSSDSNSSSCSQLESPTTNPPSVQHTCSQLIKAGLKLTIEQKRKQQSDGEDLLDLDKVKRIKKNDCSESEEDKIKQECGVSNQLNLLHIPYVDIGGNYEILLMVLTNETLGQQKYMKQNSLVRIMILKFK